MELFEGMLQKDRDEFRRVCNKLMSICFIVKRNEATKGDYYFILRMKEVFLRYLDVLGYTLDINEEYGVIQLVNRENYNHLNLKLNDSIILLLLRILYDEKKRELSLTDVVVNLGDIQEKYLSLKIREKQIDKTTMNNALRLFKRFNLVELLDRDLMQEDARIGELEAINAKEAAVENCLRIDRHQEYYLARADAEISEGQLRENAEQLRREKLRQEELERQEKALVELLQSDKREVKELLKAARDAVCAAEKLLQVKDVDACVKEYAGYLADLESCGSLADISLCLEKVISYKKKMYIRIQERLAEVRIHLREKNTELTELNHKISLLEKKRLTYPEAVTRLQQRIREQLEGMGRTGEVRILCEFLEVTNPAWQNAVEGYLGSQRFYLLAEPGDFDVALSVYDKMREAKKAYGVGLINTGKLEKYDQAPEESLAEVVSSKSIWARRYVNMILGRVHRCQKYQDLKRYPIAITRQCMRYQNHVVSAIKPEVYQTPYIGRMRTRRSCSSAWQSRKPS